MSEKPTRFASPLRYPGGKACLKSFLESVICLNGLEKPQYFEPYAGGAGAALTLLTAGAVSEVFINDADPRVSAFWMSALNQTDRFVEKVMTAPLSIDEWRRQYSICNRPGAYESFEIGFAAFYMNRCNRSGVLTGAGPIGGYAQAGEWTLGVRFNRENLAKRIQDLSFLKEQIHLSTSDAIDFLKANLPRGVKRQSVFVYLDPPYVNKGQRLYLNAYEAKDHSKLASYLKPQTRLPWIMSYDDAPLVRQLYADQKVFPLPIQYSLQEKRSANELVIAPRYINLPPDCVIHGKQTSFLSESKTHENGRN